jgi:hypothetical protein
MWHYMLIVFIPDEVYPRDVLFVVEFVQLFEKEGIILQSQVDHSKTTLLFRFLSNFPGNQVAPLFLSVFPLHKHCFLTLSMFSMIPLGSLMVHMEYVTIGVNAELIICNLPE